MPQAQQRPSTVGNSHPVLIFIIKPNRISLKFMKYVDLIKLRKKNIVSCKGKIIKFQGKRKLKI